jgi:hypothetical protein
MLGIEMRGNNKWVCFHCNEESGVGVPSCEVDSEE